jgi:N-acetylmuramoyl-L-alanine amidase
MDLFNYLFSASVCMALCYILYLLMFKRLTFFSMNRVYLLAIVTASIIIPALHIKIKESLAVKTPNQAIVISHNAYTEVENLLPAAKAQVSVNWLLIAGIIYWVVCIAMLIKIVCSIIKIVKDAKQHGFKVGKHYIVENHNSKNASFFHIIFIRSRDADPLELEQIMAHEKVHARLFHSADNLYIEVIKAFFWFNPFIYLIAKALNEVHEFEVDRTLKHIFDPKKYASLLMRLSTQPSMSLANQFSAHSLRSRVNMLFKPHSSAFKKWRYLSVVPVLAMSGYWFSVEKVYGNTLIKKDFILVLDAGHGGSQHGAVGIGGYYEKDLNLQLVQQIKSAAEKRGIRTILTRPDDRFLDLPERVSNKADAFISIHMKAPGGRTDQTNGLEIVVQKTSLYPFSKKLALSVKAELQQLKGINPKHNVDITEISPDRTLYVLKHNKAPAILIELGYITDQSDLDYVLDVDNQRKIAEKITDAVMAYGTVE